MDFQTFITLLAVALFVMGYYATNSKRGKVFCLFTGRDKTDEEKWVSMKSGYVIFRGLRFDIITRCMTSFWLTRGIHMFFPTKVNCLKYSWYCRFPHNPDNYEHVWETPEVRNAIDTSELVKSYFKTSTPASAQRPSSFQQYLPWIAILLIVLVGFWLYNNQQQLAHQLALLSNQLKAIVK